MAEPILRSNMPELDSVRGIAIIAVVLYHGFYCTVVDSNKLSLFHGLGKAFILFTQSGRLGVFLFFVLSGFLISGILLDTKERSDYFKRFYWRRALRILPAYIALLFLLWILGVAQLPFILISIFFMSNFSLFGIVSQYIPLWTLAIEEQFYLFWPQAVRRLSKKYLTIIAISIVVLTPIARFIAVVSGHDNGLQNYTWFLFDGFAQGALLALYFRSKKITREKVLKLGLTLSLAGIFIITVGAPFGILSHETFVGSFLELFPWYIFFSGIIAIAIVIGTGKYKRLVVNKWLRYFGYISYSLYLIHLLFLNEFDKIIQYFSPALNSILHDTISGLILRLIIAGGISVLIAGLSRKYFEEFFLKFKNLFYFRSE